MKKIELHQIEKTLSKYDLPEEVRSIIWMLLETVERQAREIEQLKEEIKHLKGQPTRPKTSEVFPPLNKHKNHPRKEYKKQPEEYNAVRKALLPIDEMREIPYPSQKCSQCSSPLHSRGIQELKIQELEIQRKVIAFRLQKKQCVVCGHFEMAEVDKEFRGSSFGPELRSWISLLHYRHRLTEPQIAEFLESVGIVISPSEINYLLLANGKSLEPLSEQILRTGLPKSTYAHLDESGWKTQGVSKHLWTICTKTFSYFQIHSQRNSSIANELVSFNPSVIAVSDDYSSYGKKFNVSRKQLCWLHEIRHYEKLLPLTKQNQHILSEKLTELWTYYQQIQTYRKKPSRAEKKRLMKRFDEIICVSTPYDELKKRLHLTAQKKKKLLMCLKFPSVPPENNCAERALRHAVVIRKISHGSRSEEGERAFTAHLTFLETCKKLGYDVKEQLKRALHPSLYPNWSFAFP